MEVLYHDIKTRHAHDFPLCFPHELLMSLRNIYQYIYRICGQANDNGLRSLVVAVWSRYSRMRFQFPEGRTWSCWTSKCTHCNTWSLLGFLEFSRVSTRSTSPLASCELGFQQTVCRQRRSTVLSNYPITRPTGNPSIASRTLWTKFAVMWADTNSKKAWDGKDFLYQARFSCHETLSDSRCLLYNRHHHCTNSMLTLITKFVESNTLDRFLKPC